MHVREIQEPVQHPNQSYTGHKTDQTYDIVDDYPVDSLRLLIDVQFVVLEDFRNSFEPIIVFQNNSFWFL
jgi:hypothetical protein